jgi:transcriptional regulator of arginine metabolism
VKTSRHKKIIDIINKKVVETQDELAVELQRQGYNVTQATVSRDIKELRLVKVLSGSERYRYALPGDNLSSGGHLKAKRIFAESVISFDASENIIVVKTTPGTAQAVALVIDNEDWNEVIGTVAGDDTVLAVVKPKSAVKQVISKISAYLD